MIIELDGPRIVVDAPAKVNLFLEVVGTLPSGFHGIDTLMCPISLRDRLIFQERGDSQIRFHVELPPNRSELHKSAWEIPCDSSNLVVRAVERVRQRLGCSSGCELRLVKNTPATSGMGGGSSDAASAIVAALAAWGEWDRSLAEEIAGELGSDVTYFLGDERSGIGLARCTGRGEQVNVLPDQPMLFFAISLPPMGCSTREVYSRCRIQSPPRSSENMAKACRGANIESVGKELYNALHEPATQITEWISLQMEFFKRIGAQHCMMTGSGSACFALARSMLEAEEMANEVRSLGPIQAWAVKSWYARPIEHQIKRILAARKASA